MPDTENLEGVPAEEEWEDTDEDLDQDPDAPVEEPADEEGSSSPLDDDDDVPFDPNQS